MLLHLLESPNRFILLHRVKYSSIHISFLSCLLVLLLSLFLSLCVCLAQSPQTLTSQRGSIIRCSLEDHIPDARTPYDH